MPLRSVKMYGFIFGFQRRVWWPKWTPALEQLLHGDDGHGRATTVLPAPDIWRVVLVVRDVRVDVAPGARAVTHPGTPGTGGELPCAGRAKFFWPDQIRAVDQCT